MTDINPGLLASSEVLDRAVFTLVELIRVGFTPNSVKKFLQTGNVKDLRHTGMVSVQMFNIKGGTVTEDDVVKAIQEAKKRGRL